MNFLSRRADKDPEWSGMLRDLRFGQQEMSCLRQHKRFSRDASRNALGTQSEAFFRWRSAIRDAMKQDLGPSAFRARPWRAIWFLPMSLVIVGGIAAIAGSTKLMGAKPCFVFQGSEFEHDAQHQRAECRECM